MISGSVSNSHTVVMLYGTCIYKTETQQQQNNLNNNYNINKNNNNIINKNNNNTQ